MEELDEVLSGKLDLRELQAQVQVWTEHNFGEQAPYRPLLGVVEEVGELCHAQLKNEQGIRSPKADEGGWYADKRDAVGDIVIYLMNYCTEAGIEFHDAVKATWHKVSARNWVDNPEDGIS